MEPEPSGSFPALPPSELMGGLFMTLQAPCLSTPVASGEQGFSPGPAERRGGGGDACASPERRKVSPRAGVQLVEW